jgi:pepF/M3 family oligoendopeptidase
MTFELGALPRWDLSPIYPSLESSEFTQAFESAIAEIKALTERFDALEVRRRAEDRVEGTFLAAYEEITNRLNALYRQVYLLHSYIGCYTTTDARNEPAQRRESELNAQMVSLDQLGTRYTAWVGTTDVETLIAQSAVAQAHAFPLRKSRREAWHQMPEGEEALAAELRPSSITAWAKLHSSITALLTASVNLPDGTQALPMSQVRLLANDPDRVVRKAAFEAEIEAWKTVEVPLAAALNGVKGFQITVRRKRRYADDIAPTMLMNNMDRATLEAMQQACRESFPDFRRYMDAKARALGLERLAWYDMTAPVSAADRKFTWAEAQDAILTNFGRYSNRMADFAARAFRENWIDAEPRFGKEGGAYCTDMRPGESRIFMNYDGSFGSLSTLAHELGHGYHCLCLEERLPLQSDLPMTLAETASIFCETILFEAMLEHATPEEQLCLIDESMQRDLMVVVDIYSRFLFEKSVFEKRAERDLTVSEFSALMTEAQRQTYGENLDPLHPYMWAVKGHYYGPTFYNYPYTFGLLFGLGLYAIYRREPESFRAEYDAFLSNTGLAEAATLAQRFGVDITQVDFWRASLDVIRTRIGEFERLTAS